MSNEQGDVAVDPEGSLKVHGSTARTRLQPRQGEYTLVPSPPDLIILRRVSSMHAGSAVLLAGEIVERGTILDILQFIASVNWIGEFLVVDGETSRSILLDSGAVIQATSTVRSERLGEVLYKHGAITREQFEEALNEIGPSRRLGDIVVHKGWLKPNDLFLMLQKQVEEIFYNALAMPKGTFLFSRGIDAAQIPVRVNLPVPALLMEGVQRIDEWAYFREKIPDSSVVPVAVAGRDAGGDRAGERVLAAMDGIRTVDEVSRLTGLGEFETTKAVFTLMQRGAAQIRKPRTAKDTLLTQVEGFNEVLRDVHRTVDAIGAGEEARATLTMFLQGGGAFDVLFANAGPIEDGSFDASVLVRNLDALQTDDPNRVVQQALHDYVAFALFAAGSVLKREDHQSLARRTQDRLTALRAPTR